MAARRRAPLKKPKRNAAAAGTTAPRPLVYTAQDLARFCEVDLKTIHHWADGGKIAHHRTSGRHLRFRRNHVLAFLRRHGYPLHAELASARPTVFLAGAPAAASTDTTAMDDVAKRLSSRFFVRRFGSALEAIAHLVAGEPDALIVRADDPTWSGPRAAGALKSCADTAWPALVVITDPGDDGAATEMTEAGADMVIGTPDISRLTVELARALGID